MRTLTGTGKLCVAVIGLAALALLLSPAAIAIAHEAGGVTVVATAAPD